MEPRRPRARATYSSPVPLLPPALIAAVLVLALLALIPTRRLFRRGASAGAVAGYFLSIWMLGLLILAVPGRARLLLPIVLVLAVVPYINVREGIDRLLGRPPRPPRPPMKNVTPPEER
jgi:hypothetical protein